MLAGTAKAFDKVAALFEKMIVQAPLETVEPAAEKEKAQQILPHIEQ